MRVLVTGGAGFLGYHVVEEFLAEGHEVIILDNLSTGSWTNVSPAAKFALADVRNSLTALFRDVRPELVVHLAAQVSVPGSVVNPAMDAAVNIGGTINVMEASADSGVRKVVAVSSAAVYGVPDIGPVEEERLGRPISPYGLSKLTAEAYIRLSGQQRGVAFTILRPANIYGPRQTTKGEGAVIPTFLDRFLSGKDPVIHGDGSQTRDFVYVTDMAHAILRATAHADGLTLNVSSGIGISVLELWTNLSHLVGWTRPPIFGEARPGDIRDSVLSNQVAREALDWEPTVELTEGLIETIGWIRLSSVASGQMRV